MSMSILVNRPHADRTVNARRSTTKRCVHVFRTISEVHQRADQSAPSVVNVPTTKPVSTTNVLILALELVEQMLNATSEITVRYALVIQALLEMHSLGAIQYLVSFLDQLKSLYIPKDYLNST